MLVRGKPHERFGPYVLLKKIEGDLLSELWRAVGVGSESGQFVALRRFVGGDRPAMLRGAQFASKVIPLVAGTAIVKNQRIEIIETIPCIVFDYVTGRSLRLIAERARDTAGGSYPIPIDQALTIAEKLATSLITVAHLKNQGVRLTHGALIPQLVWLTDEGEIRVSGQQLGPGLVPSLSDPQIGRILGPYFAPELRTDGSFTPQADSYSLGAILYLLLTGLELPDASRHAAVEQALNGATSAVSREEIPPPIREILSRALSSDPKKRYGSPGEMQQVLAGLLNRGSFAGTTFNLAFYLNTLLRSDFEKERSELELEKKIVVEPTGEPSAAELLTEQALLPSALPSLGPRRSIWVVLVLALLAVAGMAAAYFGLPPFRKEPGSGQLNKASSPITRGTPSSTPAGTLSTPQASATVTADDSAARQKAFEEAVNQRFRKEASKLQDEYDENQRRQKNKAATVRPPPVLGRKSKAGAAPDPTPSPTPEPTPEEEIDEPGSASSITRDALEWRKSQEHGTREGQLIRLRDLDVAPRVVRSAKPVYPTLAQRQRIQGDVILSALISETGRVLDVRVLRGLPHNVGLEEAAMATVKTWQFSAAVKNGKRVRTWVPVSVAFKLDL